MTREQAIEILNQALSQISATRQVHMTLSKALEVICNQEKKDE